MKLETGRILVFPRMSASAHAPAPTAGQLSSQIAEMDQLLGGGIDNVADAMPA